MKLKIFLLALSTFLIAGQFGCAPQPAPTAKTGPVKLKIAVLPILDALPMYVAQDQGLFEKNNIQVEFIPVSSAPERDQLVAAGQADGMINEVVSTLFFNKENVRVQMVRYARSATSGAPLFSLLAAKDSSINTPMDLKNAPIGISEGTVIDYLTDRLLTAEGLQPADIKTVSIPKLDARLALLNNGQVKAAMLPEPMATMAEQQGSKVVLADTSHPEYSFSTISFRKPVIDANPEAVRGFLLAIEQATDLINKDPSKWTKLLVDKKILPAPLAGTFNIPSFVKAGVPDEKQYADALAWAKEKGYLTKDVPYQESVNPAFLPK